MEWTEVIREAVDYIEEHITDDITVNDVAGKAAVSPFYFHKGFSMLCGFSLMEYVRNRRLSLAGSEMLSALRSAQGQRDGEGLCAAETYNIVERWLCNGLQDYKERELCGARRVKRVQL